MLAFAAQANCRIDISVKIDSGMQSEIKAPVKIYTAGKPFPMIFSQKEYLKELKEVDENRFQIDIMNSDTIVHFIVYPLSELIPVLINKDTSINFTIKITKNGIENDLEPKNKLFELNRQIYSAGENITFKLREDSLTAIETKRLIDSLTHLEMVKLNELLNKKQVPFLYNLFKKKIETGKISIMIFYYLMNYNDVESHDYVKKYIRNQNNSDIVYNQDFYILCYNYYHYLQKIYNRKENHNTLVYEYIEKQFSGLPRDILFARYFEDLMYFGKKNEENTKLMHQMLDAFENPVIKKQLTYLYNKKLRISSGKAPTFTLPDNHGNMFRLDSVFGSVIYLDFWGTWCPPCIEEIPHLEKLKNELKDYDIKFISIASEHLRKDYWLKLIKEKHLSDIQLYFENVSNGTLIKDYQTVYYPRFLIINKSGKIVDADAPRPSDPKLKEILIKLAEEKPQSKR
jgi:thiol-disulfide isomerase/thioredoxin